MKQKESQNKVRRHGIDDVSSILVFAKKDTRNTEKGPYLSVKIML